MSSMRAEEVVDPPPIRRDLRICFVGDTVCEKAKLLGSYTTKTVQKKTTSFSHATVRKTIGAGKKRCKVDVVLWAAGSLETKDKNDRSRHLTYMDKDLYVLMFSFKDAGSLENIILRWLPEIEQVQPDPEKKKIILGVHAADKNKNSPTTHAARKVALAINACGYFEIDDDEQIMNIDDIIGKIIKVGLLKWDLYPADRINGYIEPLAVTSSAWGKITVTILRANGLAPKDKNGLSDPYCKVGWCFKPNAPPKYVHQTRRKAKTLDPVWTEDDNNSKEWMMTEDITKYLYLKIQVWDHDTYNKDDFEGEVTVPITQLLVYKEKGKESTDPSELTLVLLTREGREKNRDNEDNEVSGSVTFRWKYNPRRRKLPAWWCIKSPPSLAKLGLDSRSDSDKKDKERETPKQGRSK